VTVLYANRKFTKMTSILASLITVNVLQRMQESLLALSINTESYGTRNALKRMAVNAVAMTTINLRKEILTVIVLFDYVVFSTKYPYPFV